MDLVIFFAALSVLVFFHELGHFVAAKINGVRVDEFGMGLPPKIWGKKIGETIYSLNLLPIGGFCKLYGEDPSTGSGQVPSTGSGQVPSAGSGQVPSTGSGQVPSTGSGQVPSTGSGQVQVKDRDRSFMYKKPWQKSVILVGGVFMNLILAILIFCGVYYKTGIPKDLGKVKVEEIVSGSPAEEAGIKTGDVVVSVGGVSVKKSKELIEEVDKFKGSSANLGIERDGKFKEVEVMVREDPPEGEGSMGVVITDTRIEKYPWWQMYKGIGPGFEEAYFWAKVILDGLGQMITGVFTGKIPKDVAGPVGMYQATASVRKETGLLGVLHFFGIVSVNLAVVNLLPFPALDGGRLVFVLIEKIRGKRVNEKIEATANAIGMSLLLGLIVLITIGDIVRLLK